MKGWEREVVWGGGFEEGTVSAGTRYWVSGMWDDDLLDPNLLDFWKVENVDESTPDF